MILNPAPAVQLPPKLLKMTDILVPNQSEAAILSGVSLTNRDDDQAAVLALKQLGVKKIILTLGSRGALLIDEEESVFVPAFSVTPVDTTACGDAFLGAFAVALAESKPLLEAVRWGNAAGALASTRIGAQTSLPTKDEIEQLLNK